MPQRPPDFPPPPAALGGIWVVHCMVGLFFGVVASSVLTGAALLFAGVGADTPVLGLLVVGGAGAVEGLVIGYAQWRVLRDVLPDLNRWSWVWRTALGCGLGALLGSALALVLVLLAASETGAIPAPGTNAVLSVLTGTLIGAAVGFAQMLALDEWVGRAGRWFWANLAAWTTGYTCLAILALLTPPPPATPVMTLLLMGGPLLAGLSVGAITAPVLATLMRQRRTMPQGTSR